MSIYSSASAHVPMYLRIYVHTYVCMYLHGRIVDEPEIIARLLPSRRLRQVLSSFIRDRGAFLRRLVARTRGNITSITVSRIAGRFYEIFTSSRRIAILASPNLANELRLSAVYLSENGELPLSGNERFHTDD